MGSLFIYPASMVVDIKWFNQSNLYLLDKVY